MLQIIQREAWGARHDDGFGPAPLPADEVWGHHSVTVAPDLLPPYDDEAAAMRLLERIGEQKFGGGVSYTFAIMPTGRIYEGHSVGRKGAHTARRNSIARAIVFVGNYDTAQPTPAQIEAAAQLLVHGWRSGWWKAPRLNGGHKDAPGAATACPGRYLSAAVPTINARAAALAAPKGSAMNPADVQQIAAAAAAAVWNLHLPAYKNGDVTIPAQKPADRIASNTWHLQLGAVNAAGVELPRQKAWERVNAMHALSALQKMEHGKLVAQLAALDPKSIAAAVPLAVAGEVVAELMRRAHEATPPAAAVRSLAAVHLDDADDADDELAPEPLAAAAGVDEDQAAGDYPPRVVEYLEDSDVAADANRATDEPEPAPWGTFPFGTASGLTP